MHIIIKNKYLIFDDYRVKCAIGKRGIKIKKKEGDLITPKGTYNLSKLLYRKDRVKNLKSRLKKIIIKKIWVGVMTQIKRLQQTYKNTI